MYLLNIRAMNDKERSLREKVLEEVNKTPIKKPDDKSEPLYYIVDMEAMNHIASNDGFVQRYHHWMFGKEYNRWKKMVENGVITFFELVINTEPPIVYLLDTCTDIQKSMVMAHVDGHIDFFRNNFLFKETNPKMHKRVAEHDAWFTYYRDRYGWTDVGEFIDTCISLSNLIDPHSVRINKTEKKIDKLRDEDILEEPKKLSAPSYMDEFINPEELMKIQKERIKSERQSLRKTPQFPQQDILKYIIEKSDKLYNWQKKILSMIRDESYYFAPQRQTKIMNEGWATYWHHKIMSSPKLNMENLIGFCDMHSRITTKPETGFNPYQLGFKLWQYICEKGDKGRFCSEYENEHDLEKIKNFDTGAMMGLETMLKVRKSCSDLIFVSNFIDDEFMEQENYYVDELDPADNWFKIKSRSADDFKEEIVPQLTNMGEPTITLVDGDFHDRKELLLVHQYDGFRLDSFNRTETTKLLFKIWQRPVHLLTKEKNKVKMISSDDIDKAIEIEISDKGLTRFYK